MTPSQTQALLQDAKNEVAINHSARSYIDWKNKTGLDSFPDQLADEVAELYHTRLLAEAGKELEEYSWVNDEMEQVVLVSDASALLAAKQAEVEEQDAELASYRSLLDDATKELEAKDKEIHKLKNDLALLLRELKD